MRSRFLDWFFFPSSGEKFFDAWFASTMTMVAKDLGSKFYKKYEKV